MNPPVGRGDHVGLVPLHHQRFATLVEPDLHLVSGRLEEVSPGRVELNAPRGSYEVSECLETFLCFARNENNREIKASGIPLPTTSPCRS